MSSDVMIKVERLSKCYQIYEHPRDRLKQFILPHIRRFVGRYSRNYYREFNALKDVSFEVKRGETLGILGRNGSGKSTLLQMICGTLTPTGGNIQISGRIAALLELGAGFNPEFTGRENVYMNGVVLGLSREEIDERFFEISSFAEIGNFIDQPVKTYSSGMYVRLAFAVQACIEPQILVVDEALSVGDEKFQRKCFDHMEGLRSNGCSILLVTHSTATVEKFCQRGILLHNGQALGIGTAKEIVDQYHALLYSDEKEYLRFINNNSKSEVDAKTTNIVEAQSRLVDNEHELEFVNSSDDTSLRAIIKQCVVLDQAGEQCEIFKTGDWATIRFCVEILAPVREIQAGILVRTVEGVSAFGTSTLYHGKNYLGAKNGTTLSFDFNLRLDFCPGTYFVTLSIAEAIKHGDMKYIDRKTDVLVLKIDQIRVMGSGIAALESSISVSEVVDQ